MISMDKLVYSRLGQKWIAAHPPSFRIAPVLRSLHSSSALRSSDRDIDNEVDQQATAGAGDEEAQPPQPAVKEVIQHTNALLRGLEGVPSIDRRRLRHFAKALEDEVTPERLKSLRAMAQRLQRESVGREEGEEEKEQNMSAESDSPPPSRRQPVDVDVENKIVKTVVGDLPLSPMMDPTFYEAKYLFTQKKRRDAPKALKSQWRKQLERNIYARALATSPRMCSVTHKVLPRFFLQKFRLMAHPETSEPWWTTQDLQKWQPEPPKSRDGEVLGPSAYILSREDLMDALVTPRSPYMGKHRGMGRMSVRNSAPVANVMSKAVWRDDMGSWVLELMRRRVVEGLLYFAELVEKDERQYIARCDTWDEAKAHRHRGCLLYFGEPKGAETTNGLPRLSTFTIENVRRHGKLAVHDMRSLLTEEKIQTLRNESAVFRDSSLVLLGRQRTMGLQSLLWKLQGYIPYQKNSQEGASEKSREKEVK